MASDSLLQIILQYPDTFEYAKAKDGSFTRLKSRNQASKPVNQGRSSTDPRLSKAIELLSQHGPVLLGRLGEILIASFKPDSATWPQRWLKPWIQSHPSVFAISGAAGSEIVSLVPQKANADQPPNSTPIPQISHPKPSPQVVPIQPQLHQLPMVTLSSPSPKPLPHPNPSPSQLVQLKQPNSSPIPQIPHPNPPPQVIPTIQPQLHQSLPRVSLPNPLLVYNSQTLQHCLAIQSATTIGIDCEFTQPQCLLSLVQVEYACQIYIFGFFSFFFLTFDSPK